MRINKKNIERPEAPQYGNVTILYYPNYNYNYIYISNPYKRTISKMTNTISSINLLSLLKGGKEDGR